ncbi:MAG: DUF1854 domain-containing protein [Fimbriimonadaceae bacterium]|nr:DUF1854 domain-containing protein [Fimbriimonadaceae bacterium]QYK56914.1 MAG: DUF1854 domain-containing protein [Fimbriimonadaceae bacterium]
MKLFYKPEGRLRLTKDDRSYLEVKPAWASPISHPGKYLALLDGKGREIAMVEDLDTLDPENRAIIDEELHRRYLTARVNAVKSVKTEFGVTYWTVVTDRGERELVTQSLQENANWLTSTTLLLLDVDGNRYELDTTKMDEASRGLIEKTV